MKVSVVIPTLNAECYIGTLLERLSSQTVKLSEIVVIDSESTDKTVEIAKSFDRVTVLNVERRNFNHGGTRDVAFQKTVGDIVLYLTQDALRSKNIAVNTDEFNAAMERQKAEARKAWAGSGETATDAVWFDIKEKTGSTEFLGYTQKQVVCLKH